jgi:hypothetical protein
MEHEGTRVVACVYVHVHCGGSEATFEWQYACFPYSLEKFVTSSTHCSTTVSGCATAGSALGCDFNRPPGFATRGGRRARVSNLRLQKKCLLSGWGETHGAGRGEGSDQKTQSVFVAQRERDEPVRSLSCWLPMLPCSHLPHPHTQKANTG